MKALQAIARKFSYYNGYRVSIHEWQAIHTPDLRHDDTKRVFFILITIPQLWAPGHPDFLYATAGDSTGKCLTLILLIIIIP